jgi:hypothetical protein
VPAAAVSADALGVTLNGLEITGVSTGTVLETSDVPDFNYGTRKVETVQVVVNNQTVDKKVATVILSESVTLASGVFGVDVSIQGDPKLVINDDDDTVLAVEKPVLVASVPTVTIEKSDTVTRSPAQDAITSAAVSIDVPVSAGSVGAGASLTLAVVTNPAELEEFEGFTLESGEEPLIGVNVDTNIATTGLVNLSMELNIGAYDPAQNYNIRRVSGGVESNLGTPIVTINEATGKVTFTFVAAGLSIFILIEAPESNVTTDVFANLIAVDNLTRVWRFSNANQP